MLFRAIYISAILFSFLDGEAKNQFKKRSPSENDSQLLVNSRPAADWYRGNTHAHTVLSGHGDAKPEIVAEWYLKHGYQFLILSEHNKFIDPATVNLPKNRREDFILVPGVELTGLNNIHATAMNVKQAIKYYFPELLKTNELGKHGPLIDRYVEEVQMAGGEMILNHPNYLWAVDIEDLFYVEELILFELFNGHPDAKNWGNEKKISTEQMWDELLTRGKKIYGVSSDDAHYFLSKDKSLSNPGRGWVMVNAADLSSESITEAMRRGQFYSSSGVFLKELKKEGDNLILEVDIEKSNNESKKGDVYGKISSGNELPEWKIEFIGPKGIVLLEILGTKAKFNLSAEHLSKYAYVRAKVTHNLKSQDGKFESFFAWANPVFSR